MTTYQIHRFTDGTIALMGYVWASNRFEAAIEACRVNGYHLYRPEDFTAGKVDPGLGSSLHTREPFDDGQHG